MKHILPKSLFIYACLFLLMNYACAKDYFLSSPDKKIEVNVNTDNTIKWSVKRAGEVLINPSQLIMTLTNGTQLGADPSLKKIVRRSVNEMITAAVPVRNRMIPNICNELRLEFKGNYSITFRVYNDGAAYRFETNMPQNILEVKDETAGFNLGGNYQVYWPGEKDQNFQSHFEAFYKDTLISAVSDKQYGYLPLMFTTDKGTKLLITEANLHDYPNLFLFGTNGPALTSAFPPVVLEAKPTSDRAEILTKKADYIAKTTGKRTFPWRVLIITDDKGLLETDMVYKLASPNVLGQTDWIKPGKVAWDWWNANNIYGVNFRAGINTNTYKYYVDFAAEYGLEYIILDEGWSASTTDLMAANKDLDIEALIKYAAGKNIGVILWVLWKPLDNDVNGVLDQFAKWGAKGIKVDFMQRADQEMVNFYEKIAKATAEHKMLVDFHGAYKPVGLNRKYPNVINYEGVKGLENSKWSTFVTPEHDVTIPFTRMPAGPMDYTPGAMINSIKENFKTIFSEPMSQGTRAHQAAMYVIYDSPLQMLADNPSNYRKEPVFTRYISRIPTVWDKTIALAAKSGEYIATARKHGNNWYIGAMTDWESRTLEIPLNFLEGKKYRMEILQDGINADRHAADYQIIIKEADTDNNLTIHIKMSPGGGWTAILTPKE